MGASSSGIPEPSRNATVDSLADRIADQERRTIPTASGREPYQATFQFMGTLTVKVGPYWPVPHSARLLAVRFLPDAAGSSSITLKVRKSGTPLTPVGAGSTTITLAGSSTAETSIQFDDMFLRASGTTPDKIAIETVTVSAGWTDLVVLADFG